MPLAIVTVDLQCEALQREKITRDNLIELFCEVLRGLVADALTCDDPDGQLRNSDVEVKLEYRDPRTHFGGGKYAVQVVVFANDYPSRRENLETRCSELSEQVRSALPQGVRGYAWVLLGPAAFKEF